MRRPTPIQFQSHDDDRARLEKLRRLADQVGQALAREFDPRDVEGQIAALGTRVTALEAAVADIDPGDGIVQSVVPGDYISVDNSDPRHPVVNVSQALINAVSAGTRDHHNLRNLTDGNDHPQYPLKAGRETISGQWDFTRPIWTSDGTPGTPILTRESDQDSGPYWVGADNLGLSMGGSLRWDINTSRVFQSVPLTVRNLSGVFVENPNYLNAGLELTTITGSSPLSNGIGNQIAFWEVGTGGSFTDRSYGFRIRHTGEVNLEGNLDWYRHANDVNGVLFLRFTRDSSQIQFAAGTQLAPIITTVDDLNTGWYFGGADRIDASTGGTRRFSITTTEVISEVNVRATTHFEGPSGSSELPFRFSGALTTGVNNPATNVLGLVTNGSVQFAIGADGELIVQGDTGASGQVLTSGGPGAPPSWEDGGGGGGGGGGALVYVNTSVPSGNTVGNTATETAFDSSYTIPAGLLKEGTVVRVKLFGVYSTDASSAPTLALRLKLGGTTVVEGVVTTVTGVSDRGWSGEAVLVCTAEGETGAVEAQGFAEYESGDGTIIPVNMENTDVISPIDTTGTLDVELTAEWSAADEDNSITLREMVIEMLDIASPTPSGGGVDIQVFTSSGTWDKPDGAKLIDVICIGGGGGGGSGRMGASGSTRASASGGGGGGYSRALLSASAVGSSETITVGTGGTGGAAVTTNSTNGNAGSDGGDSSFGAHLRAAGGRGGGGSSTATQAAVAGGQGLLSDGGASGGGGSGTPGAQSKFGGGGGGAGGGVNSSNANNAGGTGGAGPSMRGTPLSGGTAGAGSTTGGTDGGAGGSGAVLWQAGSGGGGGGSSSGSDPSHFGGQGGDGGNYGGGGGAGGSSTNGSGGSKRGGNGGDGVVVVVTYL
jgi:hypothetical protein